MSKTRGCTTVVLLAGLLSFAVAAEATQRYKWWQSAEVAAEIGLTAEQGADIEAIFQSIRPKLRELVRRLHREEDELTAVMHAMQAEEWEVALQIDKVEAARSAPQQDPHPDVVQDAQDADRRPDRGPACDVGAAPLRWTIVGPQSRLARFPLRRVVTPRDPPASNRPGALRVYTIARGRFPQRCGSTYPEFGGTP